MLGSMHTLLCSIFGTTVVSAIIKNMPLIAFSWATLGRREVGACAMLLLDHLCIPCGTNQRGPATQQVL
jgi:hypothetical protein